MEHIIVKFVPRLPFRSGLMLGDLSRHGYTFIFMSKLVNWHRPSHTLHRTSTFIKPAKNQQHSRAKILCAFLILLKGQNYPLAISKRTTSAMILKNTLKHLDGLNFDYGAQEDAHHFVVKCVCVCPLLRLVNECQIISITRVRCEWCVEVSNTVTETHIISTTERNAFVSSNVWLRLVILKSLREQVLSDFHAGHRGTEGTNARARSLSIGRNWTL